MTAITCTLDEFLAMKEMILSMKSRLMPEVSSFYDEDAGVFTTHTERHDFTIPNDALGNIPWMALKSIEELFYADFKLRRTLFLKSAPMDGVCFSFDGEIVTLKKPALAMMPMLCQVATLYSGDLAGMEATIRRQSRDSYEEDSMSVRTNLEDYMADVPERVEAMRKSRSGVFDLCYRIAEEADI
jgi:hypothetical protein